MPHIKKDYTPLIDVSARPRMAYSPEDFASAYEGLYATIQHWYDATNNGLLINQPIQRFLNHSNFVHFYELMKALDIPRIYARDFKNTLMHFNGTLADFLEFYKQNPEALQLSAFLEKKEASKKSKIKIFSDQVIEKNLFKFPKLKKIFHNVSERFSRLFRIHCTNNLVSLTPVDQLKLKKERILANKEKYLRRHCAAWRNVAISLPFISLWTLGYRYVTEPISPDNDNTAHTTVVTQNNTSPVQKQSASSCASVADLSKVNPASLNNLAQNATETIHHLFNQASQIVQNIQLSSSHSDVSMPQDAYTAKLVAQKDKDMEEFAKLYRQCSYNNYVKLSNGYKTSTFNAANQSLKKHGIKPLHPRLYCAGMSIASLCQAQDIFKQKRPDSYLIPAIDEILNNCHNIHHCATLKKDLQKITNSYTYSSNPSYDIKNYMQTHKNAIVFLWTPRGGGNFHHQTFFPTKTSDNLYTYSSFNRQRWGNQNDFMNFLGSKSNKWGYFTDFAEGLDNIATKYIQQDVEKHKFDIAQATIPSIYKFKQAVRS